MIEFTSTWLFSWYWWLLIIGAMGFVLLLLWSLGAAAKKYDEEDALDRELRKSGRDHQNDNGRCEQRSSAE